MKWRLVITGEGPAFSPAETPNITDADKQAVDVLGFFDGQKITAATFQVDANNVNLLKAAKKAEKPSPPSDPTKTDQSSQS